MIPGSSPPDFVGVTDAGSILRALLRAGLIMGALFDKRIRLIILNETIAHHSHAVSAILAEASAWIHSGV